MKLPATKCIKKALKSPPLLFHPTESYNLRVYVNFVKHRASQRKISALKIAVPGPYFRNNRRHYKVHTTDIHNQSLHRREQFKSHTEMHKEWRQGLILKNVQVRKPFRGLIA